MKKKPLIIANWKQNPATVGDAKKLYLAIRGKIQKLNRVDVVIASPTPFLAELRKFSSGKRMELASQDISVEKNGPHTGEVSAAMLKSVGASYALVGHSERRARGDSDEIVAKKLQLALKEGMYAVLCVGEKKRDDHGAYLQEIEVQIRTACASLQKKYSPRMLVAYEPLWAISSGDGRGVTASARDAHEMKLFIQHILVELYGRPAGLSVPMLYGGSVNDGNIADLVAESEADGYLVGGASLNPLEFSAIVKTVHGTAR